jgi:hypothetical protein
MSYVKYEKYIRSPEWQVKRAAAIVAAGGKCQLCSSTKKLNVHHNNYDRLGNEIPTDLAVLCEDCHEAFHAIRDERTKQKARQRAEAKGRRYGNHKPLLPSLPAPKPVRATPGKQITFVVTREYVNSFITPRGGITNRGIRLLGLGPKPKSGWKHYVIGTTVTVDENELAAELAEMELRRAVVLTDEQCWEVVARADAGETNLTEAYGCTKAEIKRALRRFKLA